MARPRLRYALRTLIAEVTEVFPDAEYKTGDENALGVSHSVVFDERASEWLKEFSDIIAADPRIEAVSMLAGRIEYVVKDSNRLADDKTYLPLAALLVRGVMHKQGGIADTVITLMVFTPNGRLTVPGDTKVTVYGDDT